MIGPMIGVNIMIHLCMIAMYISIYIYIYAGPMIGPKPRNVSTFNKENTDVQLNGRMLFALKCKPAACFGVEAIII